MYIASFAGRALCTSRQPLLDAAYVLLREGVAPETPIVLMRGEMECLRSTVGYAARLTVVNDQFARRQIDTAAPEPPSEPDPNPPPPGARAPIPGVIADIRRPVLSKRLQNASQAHGKPCHSAQSQETPAMSGSRGKNASTGENSLAHALRVFGDDEGFTYFIRGIHPVGRIKIGTSSNPRGRLSELSTSSPVPLEFLKVIRGGWRMERAWHVHFKDYRANLEWFVGHPKLLQAIDLAPSAPGFEDLDYWRPYRLKVA